MRGTEMLTTPLSQNDIANTMGSITYGNPDSTEESLGLFLAKIQQDPASALESHESLQAIRQRYLGYQRENAQARNEEYDEYRAISSWYCTEAFSVLLVEHFRQAKQAAISSGN